VESRYVCGCSDLHPPTPNPVTAVSNERLKPQRRLDTSGRLPPR